jgi:hypothetical protein
MRGLGSEDLYFQQRTLLASSALIGSSSDKYDVAHLKNILTYLAI